MIKQHTFLVVSMVFAITTMVFTLPSSICAQDSTEGQTVFSEASQRQRIVLADLHIIQAIKDLQNGNSSGAMGELALAQAQIDNAFAPAEEQLEQEDAEAQQEDEEDDEVEQDEQEE